MLTVIEDLCKTASVYQAEVTIQGGNVEELQHADARNMAVQQATKMGLSRPGVSNQSGPYPVDAAGVTDDDLILGKRGPVAAYRQDFELSGMP